VLGAEMDRAHFVTLARLAVETIDGRSELRNALKAEAPVGEVVLGG